MFRRTIAIALSFLAAATAACSTASNDEAATAGQDVISAPDEEADTAADEAHYQRHVTCIHHRRERTRAGHALTRGFHLKVQGCLSGQMYVNPALTAEQRVGVFGMRTVAENEAFDHKVLARLSNINQLADDVLDLRGLALKVLDVPGPKLWPGDPYNGQDFLMNDTRVHFLNDPHDVVRAAEITDGAKINPASDGPIIDALKTRAQGQLSQPHTLLSNQYHSRAPFAYGDKYTIRYFVETCSAQKGGPIPVTGTPTPDRQAGDTTGTAPRTHDHLSADLAARASADDGICLLVRAQFRETTSKPAWLDDYLTAWNETPVTLATVIFPKQDVADNAAVCESLTFNPFHSVAAHRPVGIMNKGRNLIYKASRRAADFRDKLEQFSCGEIYPDFERTIAPPAPASH